MASCKQGHIVRKRRRTGGIAHLDVIESFFERAFNSATVAQVLCKFFLLEEIVGQVKKGGWHEEGKTVHTSSAFICNSNTAARRDGLANARSIDLVDVRRTVQIKKRQRYLVLDEVLTDREGTGGGGKMGLAVAMEKREERREEVEERKRYYGGRQRERN